MDTSLEAYAAVKPHLNDLQQEVLLAIKGAGLNGLTPFEAINQTGMHDYTLRPRITELKKKGVITDTGRRRPNVRGRNEVVYVSA